MSAASAISSSARPARSAGCRAPGAPARLLIETHVREDHIHLYGFIDAAERDWFRLLTTVQGVGARLALAILSAVTPEELSLAIFAQDRTVPARAEGVGPKLAARIVNELKDKVGGLGAGGRRSPPPGRRPDRPATAPPPRRSRPWSISAIAGPRRSARLLRRRNGSAPPPQTDALIRAGLQELAQGAQHGAAG